MVSPVPHTVWGSPTSLWCQGGNPCCSPSSLGRSPRKVNQALEWLYPEDHQPGGEGLKAYTAVWFRGWGTGPLTQAFERFDPLPECGPAKLPGI